MASPCNVHVRIKSVSPTRIPAIRNPDSSNIISYIAIVGIYYYKSLNILSPSRRLSRVHARDYPPFWQRNNTNVYFLYDRFCYAHMSFLYFISIKKTRLKRRVFDFFFFKFLGQTRDTVTTTIIITIVVVGCFSATHRRNDSPRKRRRGRVCFLRTVTFIHPIY